MFDTHIHSNFSADSEMDPQIAINKSIELGLKAIAFTDHFDLQYSGELIMDFDFDKYFEKMTYLQKKYSDKIIIILAVEAGIQTHIKEEIKSRLENYPFDYIIGSTHMIHGVDPYYGTLYTETPKQEAHRDYLTVILENIKSFSYYDSLGHIEYLKRYTKFADNHLYYSDNSDVIDLILKHIISENKAFEVNTSGSEKCSFDFNILKRYKELGGETVTIGSDAHNVNKIGCNFSSNLDLIKDCGFNYIAYYKNRQPVYNRIG